jgi:hypothetical protein
MGLFRRGQAQAEPEGSGDDGSSAPANDGPPTAASPTREAAWRSAPALPLAVQRNVATIDAPRFEADLASRHSPASLAPLGHLVADDAPSGLLTDLPAAAAAPTVFSPPGPAADTAVFGHPPATGSSEPPPVQRQAAPSNDVATAGIADAAAFPPPPPSPLATAAVQRAADAAPIVSTPSSTPSSTAVASAGPVVTPAPAEPVVPVVDADVLDLPVLEATTPTAPTAANEPSADLADGSAAVAPTLASDHLGSTAAELDAIAYDADPSADPAALPVASVQRHAAGDPAGPSAPIAPSIDTSTPGSAETSDTSSAAAFVQRDADPAPGDDATEAAPVPAPGLGRPMPSPSGSDAPLAPLVGEAPLVQRDANATSDATPAAATPPVGLGRPASGLGLPTTGPTAAIQRFRSPTGTTAGPSASPAAPIVPSPPEPAAAAPSATSGAPTWRVAPFEPLEATFAPPEPVTVARLSDDRPIEAVAPTSPTDAPGSTGDVTAPLLGEPGPLDPPDATEPASAEPITAGPITAGPITAGARPEPASVDHPVIAPLVGETDLSSVTAWPDPSDPATGPLDGASPTGTEPVATPIRHAEPPSLPPVVSSLQRSTDAGPTGPPSPPHVGGVSPRSDSPISSAGPRPTGGTGGPRMATAIAVPVQRLAGAAAITADHRPSAAPAAPLPVQRSSAVTTAATGSPAPTVGTSPSAGDVALATGLGHQAADGSIVFYPPAGERPSSFDDDDTDVTVQRTPDADHPSSGSSPSIQATAAGSGPPNLQLLAGGAGGAGGSHDDLDELARRLYSRIRVQLRRELMLDRERAGSLIEVPR